MKNKIIWTLVTVVILVFVVLFFAFPGQYLIANLFNSRGCGETFDKAFSEAIVNKNTNFCLNYTGEIKYGKDWGYGIGCSVKNSDYGIRRDSFTDSCLQSMSYSTKNIELCKLITDENSKGSCVLDIARAKNDISYCSLLDEKNGYYNICVKSRP